VFQTQPRIIMFRRFKSDSAILAMLDGSLIKLDTNKRKEH